jgi:hypothetical protein
MNKTFMDNLVDASNLEDGVQYADLNEGKYVPGVNKKDVDYLIKNVILPFRQKVNKGEFTDRADYLRATMSSKKLEEYVENLIAVLPNINLSNKEIDNLDTMERPQYFILKIAKEIGMETYPRTGMEKLEKAIVDAAKKKGII